MSVAEIAVHDLEVLSTVSEPPPPSTSRIDFPVATDLEMSVTFPESGHCVMHAVAGERHLNPHGPVHGSAIFAVVDTSMGAATMSIVEEGDLCFSIEVHLRFVRMLRPGPFRVETHVVHAGTRVVQLESRVFDHTDRLVATATGSFAVVEATT